MKNLSFSTTGETTSMKERETPANPRTAAQSRNRAYFSESSKGYALLTPAELAQWKRYAADLTFVGRKGKKPYTPNAFEAYKSLTQVWLAANGGTGAAPTTPPTASYSGDVLTIVATASAGSIDFHASAPTDANTVVEFMLQPLKNANRKPSSEGYRVVAYAPILQGLGDGVQVPVAPGIYAAAYRFVNKNTGQRSPLTTIPVAGVALALEQGGANEASRPARGKKAA